MDENKPENENVMKMFIKDNYDPHVEFNKNFIPRYHQVLPKYYLAAGLSNSMILHYSLGSGKTAAAVLSVLQHIKNNVNIDFLSQFLPTSSSYKKICVIGSWQTQSQFEQELMRPEFQLVNEIEMEEITRLINSPVKDQHLEGVRKYEAIRKKLNKHVMYIGYQSFFKLIFNIQNIKNIQNYKLLIEEFKHGRVSVNSDFIDNFSNSIVIIDEMQRLYSYDGLNTYGLAAAMLNSVTKLYNIKVVYLTGTMFNTSETEIEAISCFFTPTFKFLIDDTKFYSTEIIPGVIGKRIKPEFEDYYIDLIKNNFAFYEQNDFSKSQFKPKLLKIPFVQPSCTHNVKAPINYDSDSLEDNVYVPNFLKEDGDLKCIALPYSNKLPVVLYVGNTIISDENSLQPFVTFNLELEGAQNELYNTFISKTTLTNVDMALAENVETEEETNSENNMEDDFEDKFRQFDLSRFEITSTSNENNNSLLDTAQLGLPKGYTKLGIFKQTNGVYSSTLFSTDALKEYSKIAYTVIKTVFDLAFHNEKSVIHTSRINKFGVEQYMYFFITNGAVEYGHKPTANSICKICGKKLNQHLDAEHTFRPIYISKLTGFQTTKERSQIVNTAWNIAANLYGDVISVLIISDVAYTGVSLFNTQNIFLIAPISNISKWRQIYSRVVRTNSHDGFSFEKKYVKVYTITVRGSSETIDNCLTNKIYSIKSVLNDDIEKFIKKLSKVCINSYIENDDAMKNVKPENYNSIQMMFSNDVQDELMLMCNRIFNNSNTVVWNKDTLIKKIQDNENNVSFINFKYIDKETIIDSLVINKILMYDGFGNLELTDFYKYRNNITSTDLNAKRLDVSYNLKIPFEKFENMNMSEYYADKSNLINDFLTINQSRMRYTFLAIMLTKQYVNNWDKLFAYEEVCNYLYDLCDEYYDDDSVNFVKNHAESKRNIERVIGFYVDDKIILKTGECLDIVPTFNTNDKRPVSRYLFKISSARNPTGDRFSLHTIISDRNAIKQSEVNDGRFNRVGVNCESFNYKQLKPLLTNCDFELSRMKFCKTLIPKICEFQLQHKDIKYVVSPFEAI